MVEVGDADFDRNKLDLPKRERTLDMLRKYNDTPGTFLAITSLEHPSVRLIERALPI